MSPRRVPPASRTPNAPPTVSTELSGGGAALTLLRSPDAFDGTPGQLAAFRLAESYLTLSCPRCGTKARRLTRPLTNKRCFAFACPACRMRSPWQFFNTRGVVLAARSIQRGLLLFDGTLPKGAST